MDFIDLVLMLLQSCSFTLIWTILDRRVRAHGPFDGARTATRINSLAYSLVSLAMLCLILSPRHEGIAKRVFHASKFYEYIDVLNVRASGGTIDLHFGFHHLTTPYWTFFRAIQNSDGWRVFAAFNTFHHALMYAYFGGVSFFRTVLDYTGQIQLLGGVYTDLYVLWLKYHGDLDGPVWPNIFSASLLGTYFVLQRREMRLRMSKQGEARN